LIKCWQLLHCIELRRVGIVLHESNENKWSSICSAVRERSESSMPRIHPVSRCWTLWTQFRKLDYHSIYGVQSTIIEFLQYLKFFESSANTILRSWAELRPIPELRTTLYKHTALPHPSLTQFWYGFLGIETKRNCTPTLCCAYAWLHSGFIIILVFQIGYHHRSISLLIML
jgi:hypothetical protein